MIWIILLIGVVVATYMVISSNKAAKDYARAVKRCVDNSPERDIADNPYYCPIHKTYFEHLGGLTCPSCEIDHQNDMYAGVYPPGINESNKDYYYVEDWIALRKIDLMWKDGKITEEEAIRRRDQYIRDTIPKRIAVAKGTDPEVQKAKIEANQKRLQNYAGAAQYSGITPK